MFLYLEIHHIWQSIGSRFANSTNFTLFVYRNNECIIQNKFVGREGVGVVKSTVVWYNWNNKCIKIHVHCQTNIVNPLLLPPHFLLLILLVASFSLLMCWWMKSLQSLLPSHSHSFSTSCCLLVFIAPNTVKFADTKYLLPLITYWDMGCKTHLNQLVWWHVKCWKFALDLIECYTLKEM